MKKGVVCLLIALITLSLCVTVVQTAKSEPSDIKIVSYTYYDDPMGIVVVGEVENTGTSTISEVKLTGTLTTTDASTLPGFTRVWVIDLLPNQRAPFYMYFTTSSGGALGTPQIIPEVASIELTVAEAGRTTNYQYPDLTITQHSSNVDSTTDNKGTYWVTGTLKNTGSQTAENVRILATFYNSAGRVVAVGGYTSEVLTASLAASATSSFTIGAWDQNQTSVTADMRITSYTLLVQAEKPILQGTGPHVTPFPTVDPSAPTQTSSPNTTPSDTQNPGSSNDPNPTSPPGESNASSTPEWVYAVIILVVVGAVIGAFLALRKRKAAVAEQPKKPTKVTNKKSPSKHKA